MNMCTCVCVHPEKAEALDPWELELQVFANHLWWVLVTTFWKSNPHFERLCHLSSPCTDCLNLPKDFTSFPSVRWRWVVGSHRWALSAHSVFSQFFSVLQVAKFRKQKMDFSLENENPPKCHHFRLFCVVFPFCVWKHGEQRRSIYSQLEQFGVHL